MNKAKLIVANWKMNFLNQEALNFCKKLIQKRKLIKNKYVICPPTTLIQQLALKFKNISFGSQDCHYDNFGPYTGDISVEMLKNINCKYVIVGHSERRKHHFEKQSLLKRKLESVIKSNLLPIYCVGEDIKDKRKGKTNNVLLSQLKNTIPKSNKKKIIIAYEPIWAIGTGLTPTVSEIEKVNLYIKKIITKINSSYKKTLIIYGGSVNNKNSVNFLKSEFIDGLLVGGTSLKVDKFISILNCK